MELNQGMTRHSVRKIFRTVMRRWYWPVLFAVVFALAFAFLFLSRYNSVYQVSSTFIPISSDTDYYTVSALVKNDEILDAVSKSVDFQISIDELDKAISSNTEETSAAVTVKVVWKNKEQTYEILNALKANLTYVTTHLAKAGEIKWMDAVSSDSGKPVSNALQSYQGVIIGALLGLLFGAGVSFLLGSLDKRIFDLESVQYGGNVDVIGVIGKDKKMQRNTHHSKHHAYQAGPNKQMVAVALYLNRLIDAQNKKLIMCVSPTSKCGTSTFVKNIAKVLSGIRMQILVITILNTAASDSDQSRKPEIRNIYPGVDECVLSWDDSESNLSFVGPLSSLLSFAMNKYKLILVDGPALLENIQVSMFAGGMDATIMVCRYGKTKNDEVLSTVTLLTRAEVNPIYCVWNYADKRYDNMYYPVQALLNK